MSLQTRSSGKLTYSKSICSRLIFSNQLIEYSVSVINLNNDKYRRKNSHSITVRNCFQTHLTLRLDPSFVGRCPLKDKAINFCLTDVYFHRTLYSQKFQIFREI